MYMECPLCIKTLNLFTEVQNTTNYVHGVQEKTPTFVLLLWSKGEKYSIAEIVASLNENKRSK